MTESDQRITRAREYLAAARQRKADTLPPTVLVRELAETRRHLGVLLAVLEGMQVLPVLRGNEADTLGRALADAVAYREARAARLLAAGQQRAEHEGNLDWASLYRDLARTLGMTLAARRPSYTVSARRWEGGWELHIKGVGVTQSHTLDDAEAMIRDYIALDLDVPADSFDVEITPESAEGLSTPQRETLAEILADAIAYWQREAGAKCDDCENSAAALCDDHAAALDRIDAYKVLAGQLGIPVRES